ncbi:hypothetical protein [Flavobacterium hydatis]|uniref:Lipoprotein n=1 Tax=Flavobacterium hydatis TaxID=991 RepID=A0A086AP45_FLAHY|nr:hypothetical protein [Flavobacterium hydatis]KFF18459.1 hypothetical protein IW20_06080 [Flavobacterium hydatis]OXA96793.1 hypothetical protein B0A62_05950 [Flavobacterium hydatis]
MKNKIIILLVSCSFLVSCKESKKDIITVKPKEISAKKSLPRLIDDPKLENEKILIYAGDSNDSFVISKNKLNKIEQLFPVFKAELPLNPNDSYKGNEWRNYINQDGKEETITFGSESDRDRFCLIYTYYLKQKNGEEKFRVEREKLIQMYRAVNELYGGLNYGGTYFGHQFERLHADAEYSIYRLSLDKEYYDKKYDFQKQKKLYIQSLTQYVADEESQDPYQDNSTDGKQKSAERAKRLQEKIDILQKLITNYFYLNEVQKFEMNYYK